MAENDWQARLKTGRNDDCPCGSGKKYKKCHLRADEEAQSATLAKTNADAAAKAAKDHDHEGHDHSGHDHDHDHWQKHEKGGPARPHTSQNTAKQVSAPRKVGGG
jgi:hypothetical protein